MFSHKENRPYRPSGRDFTTVMIETCSFNHCVRRLGKWGDRAEIRKGPVQILPNMVVFAHLDTTLTLEP